MKNFCSKWYFQIVIIVIIIITTSVIYFFGEKIGNFNKNILSGIESLLSAIIIALIVSVTIDLKKEKELIALTGKQLKKLSRPLFNLSKYKTNILKDDFINKVMDITTTEQLSQNYQMKVVGIETLESGKLCFDICITYKVLNLGENDLQYEFILGYDPKNENIELIDDLQIGTKKITKDKIEFKKNKKLSESHLFYINKDYTIPPKKFVNVEYRMKQTPIKANEIEYQSIGLQDGIKVTLTEDVHNVYTVHPTIFFKTTSIEKKKSMGEHHKIYKGYIFPHQGIFFSFEERNNE